MDYKELANKIWEEHLDIFDHFDLICYGSKKMMKKNQ